MVGRGSVRAVAIAIGAALAAAVGAPVAPPAEAEVPPPGVTSISISAEPGGLTTPATSLSKALDDDDIAIGHVFDDGLNIVVHEDPHVVVTLRPPRGRAWVPGPYDHASGGTAKGSSTAQLNATLGSSCSDQMGRFDLREVVFAADGSVLRLAVDFESRCTGNGPRLGGAIRYHASSATSFPAPPDADHDGIPDSADLCPSTADAAQSDADADGIGDACDGANDASYLTFHETGVSGLPGARTVFPTAARFVGGLHEGSLRFWVEGADSSDFADLTFRAPSLGVGTFVDGDPHDQDQGPVQQRVVLRSNLCAPLASDETSTGTFTIHELSIDAAGTVTRLSLDFDSRCSGWSHAVGALRFHAGGPLAPPIAAPVRIAGADRIGTAVAASQAVFSAHGAPPGLLAVAQSAVLARSDLFADALAGGPLAALRQGPLLLTPPTGLDQRVVDELRRILAPGAQVVLLGGADALSPTVEQAVHDAGFEPYRIGGADRYQTAAGLVPQLEQHAQLYLVDGTNFPDALVASAAASNAGSRRAWMLLTAGDQLPAPTKAVLDAHPDAIPFAVGGPAARAVPWVSSVVGADRYETARLLADRLYPPSTATFGVASGVNFPDAMVGATHLTRYEGPLLLTRPDGIPAGLASFVAARRGGAVFVYGGPDAIRQTVVDQL